MSYESWTHTRNIHLTISNFIDMHLNWSNDEREVWKGLQNRSNINVKFIECPNFNGFGHWLKRDKVKELIYVYDIDIYIVALMEILWGFIWRTHRICVLSQQNWKPLIQLICIFLFLMSAIRMQDPRIGLFEFSIKRTRAIFYNGACSHSGLGLISNRCVD